MNGVGKFSNAATNIYNQWDLYKFKVYILFYSLNNDIFIHLPLKLIFNVTNVLQAKISYLKMMMIYNDFYIKIEMGHLEFVPIFGGKDYL